MTMSITDSRISNSFKSNDDWSWILQQYFEKNVGSKAGDDQSRCRASQTDASRIGEVEHGFVFVDRSKQTNKQVTTKTCDENISDAADLMI